jgi:hypothetical protein
MRDTVIGLIVTGATARGFGCDVTRPTLRR